MLLSRPLLTLLAILLFAPAAMAAETASSTTPSYPMHQADPFSLAALMQLLLGLLLVIALIFFLGWLLKRVGGGGFSGSGMKVVASLPLSARERLVLVQVADKQLLLGVAPGRVNLLASYDEPLLEAKDLSAAPFAERLKEAMARRS